MTNLCSGLPSTAGAAIMARVRPEVSLPRVAHNCQWSGSSSQQPQLIAAFITPEQEAIMTPATHRRRMGTPDGGTTARGWARGQISRHNNVPAAYPPPSSSALFSPAIALGVPRGMSAPSPKWLYRPYVPASRSAGCLVRYTARASAHATTAGASRKGDDSRPVVVRPEIPSGRIRRHSL